MQNVLKMQWICLLPKHTKWIPGSFKGLALDARYYLFSDTSHFHFSVWAIGEMGSSKLWLLMVRIQTNGHCTHKEEKRQRRRRNKMFSTLVSHISKKLNRKAENKKGKLSTDIILDCTTVLCSSNVFKPFQYWQALIIPIHSLIHSFSILSDDRSKASSKTMPPHSAI